MEYNFGKGGDSDVDQSKTKSPPYPPYFSPYPLAPNNFQGYKPLLPNKHSCSTACLPLVPTKQMLTLGYWELLSPALFGTAGALFLSLFSDRKTDNLVERLDGAFFKVTIVAYTIFALTAVYYAILHVISDARPSYNDLFPPIAGALITVILLLSADYLLLYRFFPSSFQGELGDNLCSQFLSFLYLSSTTMATAGLGDIQPVDLTARALITIEIMFNLFVMATAVPLLLVQNS